MLNTVTSIVHHYVKEGEMKNFIHCIAHIQSESKRFPGFIDAKLIDSCGDNHEVISIFRFENESTLNVWIESEIHRKLMSELNILCKVETKIKSYTGLEYWFDREPKSTFMMSIITFLGLLPLVIIIPPIIEVLSGLEGILLTTISTFIIVLLMSYIVMPIMLKLYYKFK